MGYHICYIDSVILNPFQGSRKVVEIGSVGMGNRNLFLPQIPQINFRLDFGICRAKNKIVPPCPIVSSDCFTQTGTGAVIITVFCAQTAVEFFKLSGYIFGSENGCISPEFPASFNRSGLISETAIKSRTIQTGNLNMQQSGDTGTDYQD